jgi:outer membrane protein OmpA-like peptidoglycan-associated protein
MNSIQGNKYMSKIKTLALMGTVVFLSACSSVFEKQFVNEQPAVVDKVISPEISQTVEYSGIEIWTRCLHYIIIRDDEFAGYKPRYFNLDGVEPIEKSATQMECISGLLKDYPEQVVEIRGYADTQGTERYNLLLSAKRAAFVVKELLTLGVPNEQISSAAVGESEPINNNSTEEERQLNRRVEFVVINKSN